MATWQVGQIAVVNNHGDAQVYRVAALLGKEASLEYITRRGWVSGGSVHLSLLELPNLVQLTNHIEQLSNMLQATSLNDH